MKEPRQIALATCVMIGIFAVYEWAKTLLFPNISLTTSHIISTVVVGVLTAITARYVFRQQNRLLREQQQVTEQLRDALSSAGRGSNLLESVLGSVAEGLVITDRHHKVLLYNEAAQKLIGFNPRNAERLSDMTQSLQVHEAFARVMETGERAEARIEVQQGMNRRVMRLHASPLHLQTSQNDGVVGSFIDITTLERLEKIRQEFLSNVSHELRTPLAAISAYTETLIDGGLDDLKNRERFLITIQRNAERMRDLVNDISELSMIEAGSVRLSFEQLSLRRVVEEVFSGLLPRSEKHQVHLVNQVPEDCQVVADHRRLEQILTNLVDNAIKFNRPGGEVIVSAEKLQQIDQQIQTVIRVCDTGPGIPEKHLPRVFERFYRVDKARSRDLGGTGLGLAIVKHLARAHGGEASVTSEQGKGCEFIVRLPDREISMAADVAHAATH
jgi:two-component system phosphate regulon sensor histidine kinase PhoR